MLKILYVSGPRKGDSVLTVLSWESGKEYIERQRPGVREHLGILETRNGAKKEAGK